MNVLLHICCAPCAIFPVEDLRTGRHKAAGFFYNPNIHPGSEYIRRKDAVEKYALGAALNVTFSDYNTEDYFQHIVYDEAPESRCPACWRLRAEKAAEFAKAGGFDAFTTTLLGSPYQDHGIVKEICEGIAKRIGIEFYYKDFRAGFREAHNAARARGMYCQNYCGCVFSEYERMKKADFCEVLLR